jgi:transposase InsO family protein
MNDETNMPYRPQQNGKAERENKKIIESLKSMLHSHVLDLNLW